MENKDLITKAMDYAKRNAVCTDITVQDIASHAGFSIDYFNRMFLSYTGFSVMAYVNNHRLKHAATLLQQTDTSLLDIALDVGYNSHEGFIKAFKKKYGLTCPKASGFARFAQQIVMPYENGQAAETIPTSGTC